MDEKMESSPVDAVVSEERPKIRLTNVPKFLSGSVLKHAVATHLSVPADAVTCRKGDKWNFALVAVKAVGPLAAMGLDEIVHKLVGMKFKKYEFGAKLEAAKEHRTPEQKPIDENRNLNDQVTPLWKIPYEEQLVQKQTAMAAVVKKFWRKSDYGTAMSEGVLAPIVGSPSVKGYRNKCEFTIGWNREGNPCVGFSLGGFRDGVLVVENAKDCLHVPEPIKAIASHFEEHIREPSVLAKYPIYDRATKAGFWRLLMVRMHGNALMVVVQVQAGFIAEKSAFQEELVGLVGKFNQSAAVKVESLFVQHTLMLHHGVSGTEPFELVEPFKASLSEELSGLRFQISPSSFFQVNLPATALLYAAIKEYAFDGLAVSGLRPVILDVCCGTGTIGMIVAQDARMERAVGIEMVESAVEDAKLNAQLNGIENVEFRCARVEHAIKEVIASIPAETPIVAILDPPRSGVHADVIKTIRSCERIKRLVYVSCNPDAAVGNWIDLARTTSKAFQFAPFKLTRGTPVDMFPHTEHCELVLQFDR